MAMIVGSARIDERGKASGGAVGDSTGKEVSTQNYYMHTKGWYMQRPKSVEHANGIAEAMLRACNNSNIGYDQGNRLGVIKYGTRTKTKTECDCSSLVRQCVIEATGKDPGNFTTANEVSKLKATGLFEDAVAVTSSTVLYNGDILTTKTQGHTVVVVSGRARAATVAKKSVYDIATEVIAGEWGNGDARKEALEKAGYDYEAVRAEVNRRLKTPVKVESAYYPKYNGSSTQIDVVFKAIGVPEKFRGSWSKRKPVALANNQKSYKGSSTQNLSLIKLAKQGLLRKPV